MTYSERLSVKVKNMTSCHNIQSTFECSEKPHHTNRRCSAAQVMAGEPSNVALMNMARHEHVRRLYPFDVVYIDGSHDAEAVLADMVMADAILRPGGLMLLDDFEWVSLRDCFLMQVSKQRPILYCLRAIRLLPQTQYVLRLTLKPLVCLLSPIGHAQRIGFPSPHFAHLCPPRLECSVRSWRSSRSRASAATTSPTRYARRICENAGSTYRPI